MKQKVIFFGLTLAAMVLIYSCANDKYDKLYPVSTTTTCDTTTVSYAKDIVPILSAYCYSPGNGCHDAVGSSTSGYNFTTYQGLEYIAQTPLLLNDINWASGANAMPKNGSKLSSCDINKFTRWVHEGAPNN